MLSVACGGIVQTGEPSPVPANEPESSGGGAPATPSTSNVPTVDLPPCKPGFSPAAHPGEPCPYVYDGLCYADKLSACGCACKGRSGSTCSSGFPALDGTTKVSCF